MKRGFSVSTPNEVSMYKAFLFGPPVVMKFIAVAPSIKLWVSDFWLAVMGFRPKNKYVH